MTQLESEIAALVMDGQIPARIDSHNKILVAKRADQRSNIFETSFGMAADYEKLVSEMLMRVRLQKNDCERIERLVETTGSVELTNAVSFKVIVKG